MKAKVWYYWCMENTLYHWATTPCGPWC